VFFCPFVDSIFQLINLVSGIYLYYFFGLSIIKSFFSNDDSLLGLTTVLRNFLLNFYVLIHRLYYEWTEHEKRRSGAYTM